MKKGLNGATARRERESIAFTVLFVALVLVANMILYALSTGFGLYTPMVEPEYYTLSGVTDAYFEKVNPEGDDVTVYFCMTREELQENFTYGRIYDTVSQFADRYDFFHIEHLDVFYDYDKIEALGAMQRESDTTEDAALTVGTATVIFASEATGIAAFRNLSSFYVYDSENTADDDMIFMGEELVAGCSTLVLQAERPKAYFTVGHGETLATSMRSALFLAGYDIVIADLSAYEIEKDCALIVICAPIYDFEEYADPAMVSEISRLRDFVDGGGTLWVLRDPLAPSLARLDALCAEYGLAVEANTYLRDNTASLNTGGTTLLLQPAEDGGAIGKLRDRILAAVGAPLSVPAATGRCSAISLTASDKAVPSPLLKTYGTAALLSKEGEVLSEEQEYIAAAKATTHTGGSLVLFGSGSFSDEILMETDGYANKDLLLALSEEAADVTAPIGCGAIIINAEPLEHLTRGTSVLYFSLLTFGIPVLVLALGAVVYLRRRHR
ncbi:MAG: Gldg family protein [Clostridia bacterium]|nr:Gldg family protein [Clostridia bacterium]